MLLSLVSPGEHSVLVFLAQLALILVTARGLGWLLGRVGQPAVVGELLAGVLLGPSILGEVAPDVFDWLFPDTVEQGSMLYAVAWLGLVLLLAATGFESDLGIVGRLGRPAMFVTGGSLLVPLAVGFAAGFAVPDSLLGPEATPGVFAAFLAVALSISSLPVVARVLSDLGVMRRDVGQLILAAALTNDVIGWILLGLVAGVAEGGEPDLGQLGLTIAGVAAFLALTATLGRRVVDAGLRSMATADVDVAGPAAAVVVLTLGAAALTHWMNAEAVLGAFVAGMVVGRSRWRDERALRLVETVAHGLLAPVFFATAGLRVDLEVFREGEVALWSLIIVLVASVTKFAGTMVGARLGRLPNREGLALGVGLNARGALEIVIATVGLSIGVLNDSSYGAIVIMAIVTSLAAPPLLRSVLRGWAGTPDEQSRLEAEQRERSRVLFSERPPLLASRGGPASILAAQVVDLTWPRETPVHVVSVGTGPEPDLTPIRNVFFEREMSHVHRTEADPAEAVAAEARRGHGAVVFGLGTGADVAMPPLVERVLASTEVPVVLVRGERITGRALPAAFARAVVPVTATVSGRAVQELAFSLGASLGTELVLTHLDAGPHVDVPYGRSVVTQPLGLAEPLLAHAHDQAKSLGVTSVRTVARIADAIAPELIRLTLETEADLLVVGATLRQVESMSFLGPVATHVLEFCPATVVVVVTPPGWVGWARG